MADHASARRWSLRAWTPGVLTLAAWICAVLYERDGMEWRLREFAEDFFTRIFSGFPGIWQFFHHAYDVATDVGNVSFVLTLFAASLAVPLGFAARLVARSRFRAGHADPLDRARSWLASHRVAAIALVAAFPLASQALYFRALMSWLLSRHDERMVLWIAFAILAGLAQARIVRGGLRALLAPTIPSSAPTTVEIDSDEIRFRAVAVTRETRLAVGALAAVSLAVVGWLLLLPVISLFTDCEPFTVIGAYVVFTAASALLFQRASRIAVGRDGVYVGGTSRVRFHAYRDLDEVRVQKGDVELVKRDRVVLRLQLHGEDAARRDAIVARMQDGLARVKEVERDAAAQFVTSRSAEKVADAVRGAGDYRMPSVSQDALWALVEGPGVDATTRTAAAEALARAGSATQRERLRVAAAHCADPKVRVVLEELAAADDQDIAERTSTRSVARVS